MKLVLTLIGAAVLATGAWAGTSLLDDSEQARTVSLQGGTTGAATRGTTTTDNAEDISGPCDEAEHANDSRCTGAQAPAPAPAVPGVTTDEAGEDVSGPCDEAEHANDPRCTGGVDTDDDHGDNDRSGRGRGGGDDGGGDEDRGGDDDRSGSNSGRG
jgi:hypothetical protein